MGDSGVGGRDGAKLRIGSLCLPEHRFALRYTKRTAKGYRAGTDDKPRPGHSRAANGAGENPRPGVSGRIGGRYDVGVAAASGKPGAPTPIRIPVTGGSPAVGISWRMAPAASRIVIVPCDWSSNSDNPSSLTTGYPSIVTVPVKVPVASEWIWTTVKWAPRSPTGSHTPGLLVTKVTPFGPGCATCGVIRKVPFGKKSAGDGPPGVIANQAPTIGWFAISLAASWAETWRVEAASARPSPPAPRPARAARREMDARVFDGTMERTPCESLQERIGRRNAIHLSCSRSDALPSSPVNGRGRQVALVRGERHGAKV